jgi:threonine dehydrogenase-like Zn-dependent dehydrogenase
VSEHARAFWVTAPGQGEIRSAPLARLGPDEVRVRALASGISRGTESLVFKGHVPASEYRRMRCPFQEGEFPAPVKYGYASVGVVEALGADVSNALIGARIFCLYPHQDRYGVPAAAVLPVPADVPTSRAVLAANMETAVNALWDAAPAIGDRISVVGAGVVGALVAALALRVPGTEVQIVDHDPRRAALAAALGCGFAEPQEAARERDLVFHASGSGDGLALALGLAGFEATIIDLSWYGDRAVTLPLGEGFHAKRLRLVASQVGAVATVRRARRTHRDRLALALSLLTDPRFDALLSGECRFDDLPARMARLAADPDGALCHVVHYR